MEYKFNSDSLTFSAGLPQTLERILGYTQSRIPEPRNAGTG